MPLLLFTPAHSHDYQTTVQILRLLDLGVMNVRVHPPPCEDLGEDNLKGLRCAKKSPDTRWRNL